MAEDENITTDSGPAAENATAVVPKISQARLHVIIAGLWLSLFISALDTTIVTTALIKISSGFNALEQGAWLVTAYLLTYNCKIWTTINKEGGADYITAFLLITAKLSDVWGLKSLLLSCAAIFLVFSMACGGAQSMVQLYVTDMKLSSPY
jgi:MFS family permease